MNPTPGVVAAGDPQTAAAGAEILQQGGNAVDAAVAAAFASFIAEMAVVNIGGGGIASLHLAHNGHTEVFDFFSDMPRGVYQSDRADFRPVMIDFGSAQQTFYIGRASVAVPGVVAGLCHLAESYGQLPLDQTLQPAIRLAREGAVCSPAMAGIASLLHRIFSDTPASAALYAPHRRPMQAGESMHNPQLARTLTTLAAQQQAYFYQGDLAQAILADQQQHQGLITATDLARYRVQVLPPLRVPYKDHVILLPPLSSVGGVLIAFTLHLLAGIDLQSVPFGSTLHWRILAEAMRLTNVARSHLTLTPEAVKAFLSYRNVRPYQKALQDILAGATPPREMVFRRGPSDTSHLSVLDAAGNIVSLTTSAGEGAGFVVGDTGVALNNMLGEIDLHPQGFHRWPPGTRLQTMMSPALVLRDQQPLLALGSGGSTRIRSAIVQVISHIIDYQLPLSEAVEHPRLHFEEDILHLEAGMPPQIAEEFALAGYQVQLWGERSMYFGGVHAVGRQGNQILGAGDDRRGGAVAIVD